MFWRSRPPLSAAVFRAPEPTMEPCPLSMEPSRVLGSGAPPCAAGDAARMEKRIAGTVVRRPPLKGVPALGGVEAKPTHRGLGWRTLRQTPISGSARNPDPVQAA